MNISKQQENKKEPSFEASMERLQKIIQLLDGGKLPLDDTLSLYEEGIKLYRHCNQTLEDAEQKIAVFTNGEEIPLRSSGLNEKEEDNDGI